MLWSSLSAQVLNDYQDFHWESFLIASSVPFSQLVIKTTCQALEKTLVQECWTDVGLHLYPALHGNETFKCRINRQKYILFIINRPLTLP